MAKKLLVRAIVALLLHCQPAIAVLMAPPHARLAPVGADERAIPRVDGIEIGCAFNGV